MKPKAVLFDLDDTLYDQRAYILQGFSSAAAKAARDFALPAAARRRLESGMRRLYERGDRLRIFNRVLEPELPGTSARTVNEYVERELLLCFRLAPRRLRLFPAASRLLRRLRAGGVKLGLVTQGHPVSQTAKLCALGLVDYFDAVEISGWYGRDKAKPSPFLFRKTLTRLGVAPRDAVFIGDDLKTDIGAARAGMRFYCLSREARGCADPGIVALRSLSHFKDSL